MYYIRVVRPRRGTGGERGDQGLDTITAFCNVIFHTFFCRFWNIGWQGGEREGWGEPSEAPHPHPLPQAPSRVSLSPAVLREWD